ncbi:hypothetical protein C2E23DRAFT_529036 [Lenzites betulinus]|nr:hypothetical protein C2E23DRAFT_529036 [Lenzites betulinus]
MKQAINIHMPTMHTTTHTIILAKETPNAHPHPQTNPTKRRATFEAPVPPTIPVKKGMVAQILQLKQCDELFPTSTPSPHPHHYYTTEETSVTGTVLEVRILSGGDAEITIANEESGSEIEEAVVIINGRQGVTIEVGKWGRVKMRLEKWRAKGRIPLEEDATVFLDTSTKLPGVEEQTRTGRE